MSFQRLLKISVTTLGLLVLFVGSSPPAAGQQQLWTLVEETRRGDFGDVTDFGSIAAVAPIEDKLFVADGRNLLVHAFDRRLRPVGLFGRKGSGPGEFRGLAHIGGREDTIYTYDHRLLRLTLFTSSGDVIWTLSDVPIMPGENTPPHARAYLDDGSVLIAGGGAYGTAGNGLHRLDSASGQRVQLITLNPERHIPVAIVQIGRIRSAVSRPVNRADRWAVSPGGDLIVVLRQGGSPEGATGAIVLAVIPSGDTAWSTSLSPPPMPITEAGRQLAEDRLESYAAGFSKRHGVPHREVREAFAALLDLGDYQLAFDRLVVGRKGAVLLRRGSYGLESAEWWRLVDGDLTAKFTLPSAHEIVAADGTRIWSVTKGRFDEPVLVQWSAR